MGLSSIIPDDDDLMRQRPRMADLVPKPVPPPPGSNELPVTSRVMPSLSNPAVAPAVPTMGAATHPPTEAVQPKTVGQPSGPLVPPIDPGAISRLWTKADNIHNPVLRVIGKVGAGAARAAQTIGDTFVPGLTSQIPGTDLNAAAKRAQVIGSQETQQKENQNAAQTGLTQASAAHVTGETGEIPGQEAETAANTRKADAETQRLQAPIQESLQQSYADAVQKSVKSGKNPLQDPDVQRFADAMTSIQKQAAPKENLEAQYDAAVKSGDMARAKQILKEAGSFSAATAKPEKEPKQLVAVPQEDGSSQIIEAKPGMTLPKGAKTVTQFGGESKPNAEELKRSEMAENVGENLDKLQDIVTRRPELFGKLGGRETELRMLIGSNDPDIGALKTIKDQLGMAQQSAHSMRNASHVAEAANSILNSFHNGPDAINSSVKTARDSLKTFTADVQEGNPSVRKPGGKADDPLGIR